MYVKFRLAKKVSLLLKTQPLNLTYYLVFYSLNTKEKVALIRFKVPIGEITNFTILNLTYITEISYCNHYSINLFMTGNQSYEVKGSHNSKIKSKEYDIFMSINNGRQQGYFFLLRKWS